MLIQLAANAVVDGTPIWAYIIGAGGSSAAILFGGWTLLTRVRQERDKEIKERSDNTNATNNNTKALEDLKKSFDEFVKSNERRWDHNDDDQRRQDREIGDIRRQGGGRH